MADGHYGYEQNTPVTITSHQNCPPPPDYDHQHHQHQHQMRAMSPSAPPVIIGHQPMPAPQVIVVSQGAASTTPQVNTLPYGGYYVGLCDICRSCSNLCFCIFCPCYLTGKVTNRLEENCCYPCCFGILPLSVRFRSLVGIRQSMCDEGCTFLWCPGCAILRLVNEMEERNYHIQRG